MKKPKKNPNLTPTEYSFVDIPLMKKWSYKWGVDEHTAEMRLMRGEHLKRSKKDDTRESSDD